MPMYTRLSAFRISSSISLLKVYSFPFCSITTVAVTAMTLATSGVYLKSTARVPEAGTV